MPKVHIGNAADHIAVPNPVGIIMLILYASRRGSQQFFASVFLYGQTGVFRVSLKQNIYKCFNFFSTKLKSSI